MRPRELDELVDFKRRAELPGVELRVVENSRRHWRCFSTGFDFIAPTTWAGEILCGRRAATVAPGAIFCMHPGEVFSTPRVHRAGSGSAVVIEPRVFHDYLEEHVPAGAGHRVSLRQRLQLSDVWLSGFHGLACAISSATTTLELQSALVAFLAIVSGSLTDDGASRGRVRWGNDNVEAERIREHLHFDGDVDLPGLARGVGMSRFQVLRAFKRRYGMPPHAYQLCVRVGMAQQALKAGSTPAEVAAELGFVDQSHLCRHFKRLVGVTPSRYARAA